MNIKKQEQNFDMVIIGGLGHVGLPLGLSFANEGLKVCLYDVDGSKAEMVRQGIMPFIEYGAEPILKKVLRNGTLTISLDMGVVSQAKYVVVAIGTPVDEYLSPQLRPFLGLFTQLNKYLDPTQIIIIRSTVYPRTCRQITNFLDSKKGPWHIAYCPERIVQGYAIKELKELPQLVAGLTPTAEKEAYELFSILSPKVLKVSMEEAELAKLFSNAWRYIQFAVANQFYMVSHYFGVDFNQLRHVMMDSYGRLATLPSAGFAAGPCLLKDTMQLVASYNNNFSLGHAAMIVNEGLPNFIIENLKIRFNLAKTKVGILGMTFKSDIDDIRDSLSYKLVKILHFHGAEVLCSDEYVKDPGFVSKEKILQTCKIVIIGVPHSQYKGLEIPDNIEVVDLWGVTQKKKISERSPVIFKSKVTVE